MGEHGTGHGEKRIWGRTAASSHAQRFPPCQAYPLRVSPLWIHGHLHHQGHDAGLDRSGVGDYHALVGDPSGRGSSQLLPLHPPLLGAGPSNRHRRAWVRTHLRWGTEHISRSHKLSHRPLGRFWYDDAKPFVWWRTAAPFGLDLGDVGVQVPALLCSTSPYAPQP